MDHKPETLVHQLLQNIARVEQEIAECDETKAAKKRERRQYKRALKVLDGVSNQHGQ